MAEGANHCDECPGKTDFIELFLKFRLIIGSHFHALLPMTLKTRHKLKMLILLSNWLERKTLDNNDRDQVCWGCSLSRAQKTWFWSLLFKVFSTGNEHKMCTIGRSVNWYNGRRLFCFVLFFFFESGLGTQEAKVYLELVFSFIWPQTQRSIFLQ